MKKYVANELNGNVNAVNCRAVYYCNDIKHSDAVIFSNDIKHSRAIGDSHNINLAYGIFVCKNIDCSNAINQSTNVWFSDGVSACKNIYLSHAVFASGNIYSSHAVTKSFGVSDSFAVGSCYAIKKCFGIYRSAFCFGESGRYKIFNKQVDYERAKKVISDLWNLWSYDELLENNLWNYMSNELKDYIKSLPEYDAEIFKKITGVEL